MWIAKRAGLLCLCLLAAMLAGRAATAGAGGVAYLANQDKFYHELYWVDLASGAIRKITPPLANGVTIGNDFQIGP